ncbi:unnamed protein product [Adineta steineri]|uniref:Uncharacterized protein n=1 Tax=Adineta steineri TaxID=433720 RepID=A0A819U7Q9_9BILA|nr:unnamed protein product [Adineta steineri]CAF1483806.1 unnamed protein product [Adineta steineri]CAF4084645.1 unnamed protein product [Adineta steineri]CAF4142032.1 unnamed protein product [Adineta steineri]
MNNCFRQIQVLSIATYFLYGISPNTDEYIDADRWERLISTHMLNLRIFDFQYTSDRFDPDYKHPEFETLVNKFNSQFWIEHQWFFNWHYHQTILSNYANFYSRNPYRRKDYVLYDQLSENKWSTRFGMNKDPIDHICIHTTDIMKQSIDKFANATKLTLYVDFDLNRIFPLKKMTRLSIKCCRFSFEKLIQLLQYTSNVHTLKLDSILLYRNTPNSIQQNPLTRLVSEINMITKVTINKEITLEKIQLLTAIFPRMENLTINLFGKDLEPIGHFLLSKPNNNTRYLSSLCITKQRHDLMITLKILLESKRHLRDYILKLIDRKLYLWCEAPTPTVNRYLPQSLIDYPQETTRAASDIVLTGTRVPYLQCSHHPHQILTDFRSFYYDTALSSTIPQFMTLLEFADPCKILFDSDIPYAPLPVVIDVAKKLDSL